MIEATPIDEIAVASTNADKLFLFRELCGSSL